MTSIENYATGCAIQYMVSTNGKSVNGKNKGLGRYTKQIGGHLSDTSLQQLSRERLGLAMGEPEHMALDSHILTPSRTDEAKCFK